MAGGIVFEHGKRLVAVVLDAAGLVVDSHSTEIMYVATRTEAQYVLEFADFHAWLNNHNNCSFSYFGPKLTGGAVPRRGEYQPEMQEPANDSKAFLSVVEPLKIAGRLKHRTTQSISSAQKAVIELCYEVDNDESEFIYAVVLALREGRTKKTKFEEIIDDVRCGELYLGKDQFLSAILTPSQKGRGGFVALKAAVAAWNNPNKNQAKMKDAVANAAVRAEFDRLAR